MVRRRGNQRDARYGVTGTGYHFVHLIAGQLSAFARLGALCNLDLYFIRIYQIFGSHAKTSRSYLFDGTSQVCSVRTRGESLGIFTSFTGIAPSVNGIHGDGHCLVCFPADRTVTHGTGNKTFHDVFNGLYLVDRDRRPFESQEIAQKDGHFFFICHLCKLFEFLVAAQAGCQLQGTDRFRIPGMFFPVFSERV